MSEALETMSYLNAPERTVLGALVKRLCAAGNPRVERSIEATGIEATVRMACVNALRIYAIGLFALGTIARIAGVTPLAELGFVLACAAMAWSFWCLFTVARPEREHKRLGASGSHPA